MQHRIPSHSLSAHALPTCDPNGLTLSRLAHVGRTHLGRARGWRMRVGLLPVGLALIVLAPLVEARQSSPLDYPSIVFRDGGKQNGIATADLDGDGRHEVLVAEDANAVRVLWCNAQGRIVSTTTLATANPADSVVGADVDGDGNCDIVAVERVSFDILVWLGDGAGAFNALAPQSGGTGYPADLALAETTGDGELDLFWGGPSVFAGDGTGQFTLISNSASYGTSGGITVADFDSDGLADVAFATSIDVRVMLSDGTGGFTFATYPSLSSFATDVVAIDANDDGKLDLAFAVSAPSSLQVMLGDGAGTFGAPVKSTPGFPISQLASADLDGDDVEELVTVAVASRTANILERTGAGKFAATSGFGVPMISVRPTFGDFDGDGDPDFLCFDRDHDGVELVRNLDFGVVDQPVRYTQPADMGATATGDLNGDGLDEIVAAEFGGSAIVVVQPELAGGFRGPRTYLTNVEPIAVALGDLDEDGALDAIVAHEATTNLVVLLGLGDGGFASPSSVAVLGPAKDLVLGDWNGDQHLDVALALKQPHGVQILLGDGAGGLSASSLVPATAEPASIVAHDFDGDGKLDLALAAGASATLYSGDGAGGFSSGAALPAFASTIADLALADVDGDGISDLAIVHSSGATKLEVLISGGQGGFTPLAFAGPVETPCALAASDVDGDGDDDLYVLDSAAPTFGVFLGDASGTPVYAASFHSSGAISIALGRFDGDGIVDVAGCWAISFAGLALSCTADAPGGAAVYCTPKKNSLNCIPWLGWAGVPDANAGSGFTVSAYGVLNQKPGMFFYSTVGPNSAPFQGGTLCVKPPTKRTAIQGAGGNPPPTDCSGTYAIDFNAQVALGVDPALVAGAQVFGQFWSRDPGFGAPNNTGLTAGIRFTLGL